jgi:hypothetical protein
MKPKTFTYNQIIQFFLENNLPLSAKQVELIGVYHREELRLLENHRKIEKEKRERKTLKRMKRKEERLERTGAPEKNFEILE